ncbi:MAG: chorismate mutase [Kiritimatiellae bacterium]|nr:chorismate mutase [Kiritimatiellia bacterium]
MTELDDVRQKIDRIDEELVRLFLERLAVSREVALAKRSTGGAITDPAREREILSRVSKAAGLENENAARLFFSTLFSISKARQRGILKGDAPLVGEIRSSLAGHSGQFPSRAFVACCGTEGSYAQQAAVRLVRVPTIVYFNSFEKVFEAVEKGLCAYGVLPVENSAAGSVSAVYDLMQRHSFHISRAVRLKVDHVLLAPPGVRLEDVREVVSHPHALAQCSAFFKAHPATRQTPAANTAVAAKEIAASGRRDAAVIASRACAELYGLSVVAERIQDAVYNYTRFICISKNLEVWPDSNRISLMLSLPHRPGALAEIISKFAAIDVNLTKLESRPVPGMDFEFRFIFDFEASPSDGAVLSLLSELSQDPEIEHFAFLGAYGER